MTPQPQNSKEDFCLSNKIFDNDKFLCTYEVKEFIKRLKYGIDGDM
jgi:hypothetical protein